LYASAHEPDNDKLNRKPSAFGNPKSNSLYDGGSGGANCGIVSNGASDG
jgi:hypothetical protein